NVFKPLRALNKYLVDRPFIDHPCRRCGQQEGRPAVPLLPPDLSRSQPCNPRSIRQPGPPLGPAAASLALPLPRRKERAPRSGKPGPTSCPGKAGRQRPPRPALWAREAAGPQQRACTGAPQRRAGTRARGQGDLAALVVPRSGPAPPHPARPGGERVKRAGGGAAASPERRVRAAGGEGAAAGGGSGRRGRGRGRAEEGGGPQKLFGARPAGGRASGQRAGGRTGPGLEKFARRLESAGCGPRRPLRARCHGFPQEDEKLPALQPGVRHPQPCGHRLLPGALRPHRAYVRDSETVHYHYGPKDLVTILFYVFITIILHAVVQEYILDKISKRLHLSKVKHSKFNESGQLVVFHLSSVVWCFYVVVTEGYLTNPRSLWEDYPHVYLPFQVKFFYLCQLAYWLHALPELYFQKVRKEEIPRQLQYICLYLVHIAGAYLLKFNAWAAVFGVTRLFILTLAVLAIGFGLARIENQAFDPEKGNFNTLLCRLCVLLLVCAAQAWLMWRFIHSQLRHWREYWNEQSAKRRVPAAPRLPARLVKRESGYHENGVVKAENGTSPRTKKLKSP
uniref:TLC domain-containing protein n=1 Tax=Felis catus TaxID=9685 RepID=A0ABI7YCN7_FELCA